jgi:formylglycine-generating enzyme
MTNHHIQTFKDSPLSFKMIHIEGGTFDMGSNDEAAFGDEKLVHPVTVCSFHIAEFPVTQALWAEVMKDTDMPDPAYFKGHNHPVETVSWDDITEGFLPKLNEMTKGLRPEGSVYRLPTEAQWEYAAKGGTHQKDFLFKYAGSNKLNEVGWYDKNSHGETKPVGLKTPNLLGLYDMSGNVWEWCADHWHDTYEGAPDDGSAWGDREEGTYRVQRGGSWYFYAQFCRSTYRDYSTPSYRNYTIGFRLVLVYPSV